ncbi:unnamed protein product [Cuscuta europaea]|uniref:Retrotransposon Copia-like N-terminal domain-containing protein n=1 Tax=Cuscuta europaea TaxID=41803 RepID=A0A9P1E9X5_CUSEU|nr:unnamed protein product [Cuscuta europaea]
MGEPITKTTDDGTKNDNNNSVPKQYRRRINDLASSFYLPTNDIPGVNICGITLKGDVNYQEWSTAMRNAFTAKRKLPFLDGTIEIPDDEHGSDDWPCVNSMLVGWLMTSIDSSLRTTIAYMDSAQDLWEDVKLRFEVADGVRFHKLKEAIQSCRQGDQTVTEYFGRLRMLWDDFDGYRTIPKCKCGGCKCDLEKQFMAAVEKEKVHEFLMGLNGATFGGLRSNILSESKLTSLSRVYHMMIQEERHKNVTRMHDAKTEVAAFAVRFDDRRKPNKEKMFCSFSKKDGHERNNCFKLTGEYPEWWFANKEGKGRGKPPGHVTGRDKNGGVKEARVHGVLHEEVSAEENKNDKPDFTSLAEQWASFFSFMNNSKKIGDSVEKLSGPHFVDADWNG